MSKAKSKTVKLTDKQQEVVNLMADGWVLSWHGGLGNWCSASASLLRSGENRKVPSNIPDQLENRGLLEMVKSDWKARSYKLNEAGKALAKPVEVPAIMVWWRSGYDGEPASQEFVRETDACLIRVDGQKELKSSSYTRWYPTREACIESRRKELEMAVTHAAIGLGGAKAVLEKFNKRHPA